MLLLITEVFVDRTRSAENFIIGAVQLLYKGPGKNEEGPTRPEPD